MCWRPHAVGRINHAAVKLDIPVHALKSGLPGWAPQAMSAKPGKPADIGPGGQQVRAYLDRETIDRARQLGNGNFSLGLRIAVKQSSIIRTGNKAI